MVGILSKPRARAWVDGLRHRLPLGSGEFRLCSLGILGAIPSASVTMTISRNIARRTSRSIWNDRDCLSKWAAEFGRS